MSVVIGAEGIPQLEFEPEKETPQEKLLRRSLSEILVEAHNDMIPEAFIHRVVRDYYAMFDDEAIFPQLFQTCSGMAAPEHQVT